MNKNITYTTPVKCSTDQVQTEYKPFKRQKKIQRTSSKDSIHSTSSKKSERSIDTGGYIKFKHQENPITPNHQQKTGYERVTSRTGQNGHKKSMSFLTNLNYTTTAHSQIPQSKPYIMKKTDPTMKIGIELNQNNGQDMKFTSKNYYTPRLRATSNIQLTTRTKPIISYGFQDISFTELNESSIIQDADKNGLKDENEQSLRNDYFFGQQLGNAISQIDCKFTEQLETKLQQKTKEIANLKDKNYELETQIKKLKNQSQQKFNEICLQIKQLKQMIIEKDTKIFDLQNKLKNGEAQGSNKLMLQEKRIFDLLKKNKQVQDELERKAYNIQILNEKLKSVQDSEMELRQKIVKMETNLSESRATQRYDHQKSYNCSFYLESTQDYSLRPCQELQFYRTQLDYVTAQLQKKQQAYSLTKKLLHQTQTKLTTVNAKMKYQRKKIQFQAQTKYNNLLSNYRQVQKDFSHLKRITRNEEVQLQLSP